jgi:murein DD-endopeptidase MepM/ murein hydrolase activator NlpD
MGRLRTYVLSPSSYYGRHRAYAGRHRGTERTRTGLPRVGSPGFLVPTAAVATIVLTTTGAQMGGTPAAVASPTASSISSSLTTLTQDTETQALLEARTGDRASRGSAGRSSTTGNPTTGSAADAVATDAIPLGTTLDSAEAKAEARTTGTELAQAQAKAAAQQAAAKQAAAAAQQAAAKAAEQAAAAQQAKAKAWVPPIDSGFTLTSGFGMRWGSMHPGQDFAIPVGTPVHAMSSGTVILAEWSGGYGNKVEIRYWDGTVSWFAHNSKLLVSAGDTVTAGQVVSLSGNTGHSTGPHLHVEIHPGGADPVPPIPWLTAKGIMP